MLKRNRIFLAGAGALIFTNLFSSCGQAAWPEHDAQIIVNPMIEKLNLWPPTNGYLRPGDSLYILAEGLHRVYSCTRLLQLQTSETLAGGALTLSLQTEIEIPANPTCPLDPSGLDTTLRIAFSQAPGTLVFLKNGNALPTLLADTLVEARTILDTLDFITDSTRTSRIGKFFFLDSSALRPKRLLISDTMGRCETFEGAVFARQGLSVRVRFRRITLDSLLHAALRPCMGIHTDTIEVVLDKYGYTR